MSLGVAIKGPEGLVLAAESRLTVTGQIGSPEITVQASYDHATKIFSFAAPHNYVGVVTYGLGTLQNRSAFSFIPEFENSLPDDRLPVKEFADKMACFYETQWERIMPDDFDGPGMTFLVGGFDENQAYGESISLRSLISPSRTSAIQTKAVRPNLGSLGAVNGNS